MNNRKTSALLDNLLIIMVTILFTIGAINGIDSIFIKRASQPLMELTISVDKLQQQQDSLIHLYDDLK